MLRWQIWQVQRAAQLVLLLFLLPLCVNLWLGELQRRRVQVGPGSRHVGFSGA